MRRSVVAVLLVLLAACGGHRSVPPVSPSAANSPLTGAGMTTPAYTLADSDVAAQPPVDPALIAADTAAELRVAADSLKDEAVLEELAEAHPGEDSDEATGAHHPENIPGGTEALANAVSWDIDVETFNSHARVQ